MRRIVSCLLVLVLCLPAWVHAQLFDRSSEYFHSQLQHDSTTTRGGISMYVPPSRGSQTLYESDLTVRSVCGFDFDFNMAQQIIEFLETAPDQLEALLPGGAFVLLCQFFPSICDGFKHIQGYANQTLRFLKGDCQKMMQLGHLAGIKNRSEAEAACVQEELGSHGDIEQSISTCSAGLATLRGPNGVQAPNINVLQTMLETAGVEPEWRKALGEALPTLELSTHGPLFRQKSSAKPDATAKKQEEETLEFELKINQALQELAATGEVVGGLQYLGGAIPNDALYAMLQMDALRRDHEAKKMASNMGLTKTIYDYLEAASRLNTSMQVSALSDAQRRTSERQYDYLLKEVQRLKLHKQVPDMTMAKQLEALFQYNAENLAWAAQSVYSDPTRARSSVMLPETGQNIMGYID